MNAMEAEAPGFALLRPRRDRPDPRQRQSAVPCDADAEPGRSVEDVASGDRPEPRVIEHQRLARAGRLRHGSKSMRTTPDHRVRDRPVIAQLVRDATH